jgi:hypothetical protein
VSFLYCQKFYVWRYRRDSLIELALPPLRSLGPWGWITNMKLRAKLESGSSLEKYEWGAKVK